MQNEDGLFCLPATESSRAQFHPSTWSHSIKDYPDTPPAPVFLCQSLAHIQNDVSGSRRQVWGHPEGLQFFLLCYIIGSQNDSIYY